MFICAKPRLKLIQGVICFTQIIQSFVNDSDKYEKFTNVVY